MLKSIALFIGILSASLSCFLQKYTEVQWTKQDEYKFQLARSRSLRTETIAAAIGGPALTAIGVYLLNKESAISVSMNGGWVTATTNNSPNREYGTILTGLGAATTITAIPLFIGSAKIKKQAKLLLSDQSTSYLGLRIAVPSFGLQVNL